jgi:hypothetical protein
MSDVRRNPHRARDYEVTAVAGPTSSILNEVRSTKVLNLWGRILYESYSTVLAEVQYMSWQALLDTGTLTAGG